MVQPDFDNPTYTAAISTVIDGYSHVVVGPAKIIGAYVYNANASSTLYLQFFDATSVPSNSAVPTLPPLVCASKANTSLDFASLGGLPVLQGIVWVSSTTDTVLTQDTAPDLSVTLLYQV